MIHEIDETLKSFVKREALNGSGVEVVFEAPTKDWAARRSTPTVNVYLYDIREDTRRRMSGAREVRDDAGRLVQRHRPPRYFRLSYLVTAWTQRPEDEHRLLSALLAAFLRHEVIPADLLVGSTAEMALPVALEVGKPPADNRQISDTWSALGGELKPSLDLVVCAPISALPVEILTPPPEEELDLRVFGSEGQAEAAGGGRPPRPVEPRAEAEAAGARG